ncbi:phosphotransferase family protein [Mycobacterium sp. PS03-16]|uniref:phosphotransferase family protein n=1 Tax=Mycobacterium sp. PS03-16 TaxID=2559611 RepID=UPI001FD7C2BE|nr:aminoglycoside phosphotransferase family protein [Mycobacterium sp. PS03-16]
MQALIPGRPAEVTPQWLSTVLSIDGAPVGVAAVDVTPVGTGQTGATYRLSVTYTDAHPDLPATFVVKLPSQDETVRERVALGYRSEHAFYTAMADRVAVPMPHCYHCDAASDGADFVLLLADMSPAVQGDQLAGCREAEARLAVEALAGLHGPTWCDPDLDGMPGIVMPRPDADGAKGFGDIAVMAAGITADKLGERMSMQDRDTLSEAMSRVTPWLLAAGDRFALLHGDFRLDNLLFDPERTRVAVVDWQTLGVGLPARDLAYFTATSLLPDERSTLERDLVDRYHAALAGHGVTGYDAEDCWRDYRLGVVQAPLITALGFAFASSTERGDEMALTMLERGCRAVRELGALELIDELGRRN